MKKATAITDVSPNTEGVLLTDGRGHRYRTLAARVLVTTITRKGT
jgi:hypothetical protein